VNSTQSPSEYLDLKGVAKELQCSVRTVRRYLKEGRLGYSQEKKGGVIRVSREDIAAYYQASRRGPVVSRRRSARAAA
jgi:excisionase family DNA binding protein